MRTLETHVTAIGLAAFVRLIGPCTCARARCASCDIHQRQPATIAGVLLFLSARFFPLAGDSGGCNPSSLHLHSIRELGPIGPPCPCRILALSFQLSLGLLFFSGPVSPFNSRRLSNLSNCLNIFILLIVLLL